MPKTSTISIAALTGGKNTPSTRFRVRQHIPRLARLGVTVREHIPFFGESCGFPSPFKMARVPAIFTTRQSDVIWISRDLVQGYETFERLLKRPRVLDVDDAIWLSFPLGRFTQPHIARAMDAVIVGNQYLADWYSRYCPKIYLVPTGIDLDRYQMRNRPHSEPEKFVIGWTGLACNLRFLQPIESVLQRFLREHKRAELLLLSNKPWKTNLLPTEKVRFVRWSPENEATTLHSMAVGIMPLPNDKWACGKCSFKMLQYMAVGLPVIVSPVGMNKDILQQGQIGLSAATADEWYQALDCLYRDWDLQQRMGLAGREVVQQSYSAEIIAGQLARIFKELAGL